MTEMNLAYHVFICSVNIPPQYTCGCSFDIRSELVITRPMSTSGSLRPMSAFAKMAASMGDPRYMVR